MLKRILCLNFIFLLLGCNNSSTSSDSSLNTPQTEQYDVYKAVITDSQFGIYYRQIAVEKYTKTSYISDYQLLKNNLPLLDPITLKDFNERNRKPVLLSDSFNVNSEFVFFEENQYSVKRFPQGRIAFSDVGFNSQMNQALVYLERITNNRTSAGVYLLLFKENDTWKVKQKFASWME